MTVTEIRRIATGLGIKAAKLSKVDLVRAIQRAEGNFDCFATAYAGECDQHDCSWRSDCFAAAKKLVPGASGGRRVKRAAA